MLTKNCKLCSKSIDVDNCSILTLLSSTHDSCGDVAAREQEFSHLLDTFDKLKYGANYEEYKRLKQEIGSGRD